MYEPPKLLRHGNFRDLTRVGVSGSSDLIFFSSITGGTVGGGGDVTGDLGITETGSR